MALVTTRRPKSYDELAKAISSNADELAKAVEHLDIKEISRLIQQLKSLEDEIFHTIMNDPRLTIVEKNKLRTSLAHLQAILRAEQSELKTKHLDRIKMLARKEKKEAKEMIVEEHKIEKDVKEPPQWNKFLDMLQTGDIIGNSIKDFTLGWGKAAAVFMIATGSKICHVGIVDVVKDRRGRKRAYVIEAGDKMERTPIEAFLVHHDKEVAVYRYKHGPEGKPGLTEEQKKRLMKKARGWVKKWWQFWKKPVKYDFGLSPGDNTLYCSELVDEAYKSIGINLARRWSVYEFQERVKNLFERGIYRKFGFNFSSPQEALNAFMGKDGFYHSLDPAKVDRFKKTVITPGDVLKNPNTVKIFDNISVPFG
jgi:hypothetical protein